MATIGEVHREFGNAAETGQLLETQLGSMLLEHHVIAENLIDVKNPMRARELVNEINRDTLGQLLRKVHKAGSALKSLEAQLVKALYERNRLMHHFFRHHNLRRGSDEGRDIMLKDLVAIHDVLLEAYKAVMLLDGFDLDAMMKAGALITPVAHEAQVNPNKRLPI